MPPILGEWAFWAAVVLALAIKHGAEPYGRLMDVARGVVTSALGAMLFAPPLVDALRVNADIWLGAVYVVTALMCERIGEQLLRVDLEDLLGIVRGRKK